jgi:hypothetical protein
MARRPVLFEASLTHNLCACKHVCVRAHERPWWWQGGTSSLRARLFARLQCARGISSVYTRVIGRAHARRAPAATGRTHVCMTYTTIEGALNREHHRVCSITQQYIGREQEIAIWRTCLSHLYMCSHTLARIVRCGHRSKMI